MKAPTMLLRCPNGHERTIDPRTVAADDFPMCATCYLPAFPVEVKTTRRKS